MVMIKCKEGIERYSLSKPINMLAERCKQKIHEEDSQVLGIIYGGVGSGKSVFAQHFGHAIDKDLDVTRVCFNKQEFIDAILNSRKRVIIADEGISIFFSRASMTKEGRLISELMAQIRQKNLCVFICVPEPLSVDWLILKEANFLCEVFEEAIDLNGRKVKTKGSVFLYPEISGTPFKTRMLHYLKSKRSNPLRRNRKPTPPITQKGNPIGETFKKPWYPVGEEAYRKKKEAVLEKYKVKDKTSQEEEGRKPIRSLKKDFMMELISTMIKNNPSITYTEIAKLTGYSRQRVSELHKSVVIVVSETNNNTNGTEKV
jgi:hypothetical protein